MKEILDQDRKVMFDFQGKKRFGVITGLMTVVDKYLYIVKLDKKIKDHPYECVGVYGQALTAMEEEDVQVESYDTEVRRGGCIS